MVRSMRSNWQKPQSPKVVDAEDVAELLGEKHLENRISAALGLAAPLAGIWFFIVEAVR
jgi:hypothetical protein